MTHHIAIVGGGISGALTVLNCIKQCQSPLSIIWFDAENKYCKGYAYSLNSDIFLLNVRASNMSIFVDEPNHFVEWLSRFHPTYKPTDFVPRQVFGNYVESVFNELEQSNPFVTIHKVAEEVVSVHTKENGIELKATKTYAAQKLVLALGNFLPAHPASASKQYMSSENYSQNAFDFNLMNRLKLKDTITIIGSGLTMIDVVVALHHSSFKGKIQVISPHAYVPQSHQENALPSIPSFIDPNKKYSLLELVSLVNQKLKFAKQHHLSTFSVVDSLRPYLQGIWLNFSTAEKFQFMRHLRHKWGVARHRVPNQSMAIFNELASSHQLLMYKGRISDIKMDKSEFEITYSNSNQAYLSLKTEFIINCTGPESNYLTINNPLVKQLINDHIIEPDAIFYGLKAQKDGQLAQNIYSLGPPLKGILWESTAVPEIRLQARDLASKIICN